MALALFLFAGVKILATTRYVDAGNMNSAAPYTNWASAAAVIQDAVDVADPGDEIILTNGVYQTGGRLVSGAITNRVAVTKPIIVRSVNGPTVTFIQGHQVPGATNGSGAVRCVYLTNGAVLAGLTLNGGATANAGDYYLEESGGGVWCASGSATVSNCVLSGNSAAGAGGGAYGGTFIGCTFTANTGGFGGAAGFKSILNNCVLSGNKGGFGGATYDCTLNNCALSGNSANEGGGVYYGTLQNCSVTGNSAWLSAGGASQANLNNCILYYNTAPADPNFNLSTTLNYCCTTPLPGLGTGNLTAEPEMASASHLSALSPCRGAGNAAYAKGTDIDGEAWTSPPSVGCDEFHLSAATNDLLVRVELEFTNVGIGFGMNLTAAIDGLVSASRWDLGDGTAVSNRPYVLHAWAEPGDKTIFLRAYNATHPDGISASGIIHVVQAVHYVALDSAASSAPYASWTTAATSIQDAVDAATVPGALILVSNGVYAAGSRTVGGNMMNRVVVTNLVQVRGLNGPEATVIQGYPTAGDNAVRCAYLGDRAVVAGFTLRNGATRAQGNFVDDAAGGGVWCASHSALLTNCVLSGNFAVSAGGGALGGTLINCLISSNYARGGGGTSSAILKNCHLVGNSAFSSGGGASGGSLEDCILVGNLCPPGSGGGAAQATLTRCLLMTNSAVGGGGAQACTINHSVFTGNSAADGGAASGCTVMNSTFVGNSATLHGGAASGSSMNNCLLTQNAAQFGGGAYVSFLTNCTVVGNSSSSYGGGSYSSSLNNSIVYGNSAANSSNYDSSDRLNFCCTSPLPTNGVGNFDRDPLFVDAGTGNLRLQFTSPCIDAGQNAYVSASTDLDGRLRIVGGTVDLGAYESQPGLSGEFIGWLQQFNLPTDGSADDADSDQDGMANREEWVAGTNPTNSLSALRILSATRTMTGIMLGWTSASNRIYTIEMATKLTKPTVFSVAGTNISAALPTTSFTDTNATGPGPYFYRVGVRQ